MYSVVLLVAMTGGGDAPAGLFSHGCNGGCTGSSYGSCSGGHGHAKKFGHHGSSCYGSSCYGGCTGISYGCTGGHGHAKKFGHHGSSCYGGCTGVSYGCTGGHKMHGHGGHGCCGGGGHKLFGHHGHSCNGGNYGGCTGGCYGSSVGTMGGCYGTPVAPPLAAPVVPAKPKKTSIEAAPATLVISVPADARLTIDGEATTSTSTQRVFVSPTLEAGRDYHYTVKAEFAKDGKTVTMSKIIAVQAGNETAVSFDADNQAEVASR